MEEDTLKKQYTMSFLQRIIFSKLTYALDYMYLSSPRINTIINKLSTYPIVESSGALAAKRCFTDEEAMLIEDTITEILDGVLKVYEDTYDKDKKAADISTPYPPGTRYGLANRDNLKKLL